MPHRQIPMPTFFDFVASGQIEDRMLRLYALTGAPHSLIWITRALRLCPVGQALAPEDLARDLGVPETDVAAALAELERLRFAERVPGGVALTEEGRATMVRIRYDMARVVCGAQTGLSAWTLAQFAKVCPELDRDRLSKLRFDPMDLTGRVPDWRARPAV